LLSTEKFRPRQCVWDKNQIPITDDFTQHKFSP
jgi:hypothetical protein